MSYTEGDVGALAVALRTCKKVCKCDTTLFIILLYNIPSLRGWKRILQSLQFDLTAAISTKFYCYSHWTFHLVGCYRTGVTNPVSSVCLAFFLFYICFVFTMSLFHHCHIIHFKMAIIDCKGNYIPKIHNPLYKKTKKKCKNKLGTNFRGIPQTLLEILQSFFVYANIYIIIKKCSFIERTIYHTCFLL